MDSKIAPLFSWKVVATTEQGPGPRSRHCLVYDRTAKAAILFGGIIWNSRSQLQSDTWELRNQRWYRIKLAQEPPARHRGAMVYDDSRGQSILFGGQGSTGAFLRDTWIYKPGGWQQRATGWWGSRPTPRCGHGLAYDEATRLTVLFGGIGCGDRPLGDTWLFDGSSWQRVAGEAPSPRRYAAFAYDPDLQGCVLHGGAEDDHGRRTFGDTWLFRENVWTKLGTGFQTDPRDDHGLAYHRTAKRLVMLEGISAARNSCAGDWWSRSVESSPLHPRHQCEPLVWDEDFGGPSCTEAKCATGVLSLTPPWSTNITIFIGSFNTSQNRGLMTFSGNAQRLSDECRRSSTHTGRNHERALRLLQHRTFRYKHHLGGSTVERAGSRGSSSGFTNAPSTRVFTPVVH